MKGKTSKRCLFRIGLSVFLVFCSLLLAIGTTLGRYTTTIEGEVRFQAKTVASLSLSRPENLLDQDGEENVPETQEGSFLQNWQAVGGEQYLSFLIRNSSDVGIIPEQDIAFHIRVFVPDMVETKPVVTSVPTSEMQSGEDQTDEPPELSELVTDASTESSSEADEPPAEPTSAEVTEPTAEPSSAEATEPTAEPSSAEVTEPTAEPSSAEVTEPTAEPTSAEATEPTAEPTSAEDTEPTAEPTSAETTEPTAAETNDEPIETEQQLMQQQFLMPVLLTDILANHTETDATEPPTAPTTSASSAETDATEPPTEATTSASSAETDATEPPTEPATSASSAETDATEPPTEPTTSASSAETDATEPPTEPVTSVSSAETDATEPPTEATTSVSSAETDATEPPEVTTSASSEETDITSPPFAETETSQSGDVGDEEPPLPDEEPLLVNGGQLTFTLTIETDNYTYMAVSAVDYLSNRTPMYRERGENGWIYSFYLVLDAELGETDPNEFLYTFRRGAVREISVTLAVQNTIVDCSYFQILVERIGYTGR